MHDVYGIDLDSGVLDTRSGRWLMTRITGLLTAETRLQRALSPEPAPEQTRR